MESYSEADAPSNPPQTEEKRTEEKFIPRFDNLDEDVNFLEPYQPNNTELHGVPDDTEGLPRRIGAVVFERPVTPHEGPLGYGSDQPLAPSKYASIGEFTEEYWKEKKQKMMDLKEAEMLTKTKNMSVPMARVKKIMRIDDDVKNYMIASDAPIFMAQAAEFFIEEMTGMGWQFVSESRRRILQRNDISAAVKKNDQFDFLIDFLPPPVTQNAPVPASNSILLQTSDKNILRSAKEDERVIEQPSGASTSTPVLSPEEREEQLNRSFEERRKKEIPPHRMASDRFKCVLNETPRGNEYQIMEVPRSDVPTTSAPSTSTDTSHFSTIQPPARQSGPETPGTSK